MPIEMSVETVALAAGVEMVIDQELDQLLRKAITNKRLLRFRYKDNERIAEPHDYGVQNGIIRLFCWQEEDKAAVEFRAGA